MRTRLKVFEQPQIDNKIYSKVKEVGNAIFDYCSTSEARVLFDEANSPGSSSSKVQDVFLGKALELGFQSEKNIYSKTYQQAILGQIIIKKLTIPG